MDTPAPPWLDDSFLVQVLQSVEDTQQDVEVVKWQCRPAAPPGSNYLSLLYRVAVDYRLHQADTVKSTSLIVKTPTDIEMVKMFVESSNGYKNEFNFYNELLPKMYELQKLLLAPRSYFCPLDSSLVLEDLAQSGYKMADRLEQLDLPHCHHFMVTLARMHALSVEAFHRQPQLLQCVGTNLMFDDGIPDDAKQQKQALVVSLLKVLVMTVNDLADCKKYADMIQERIKPYWGKMVRIVKPREGLNVLNHGDPWTNNMMFRYNDAGEVVDAKLVDFQFPQFCSFAIDLNYFWWTSANEAVREHHREELFEVYRQTLNQVLHDLDCNKSLSKEDFDREMQICSPYSLLIISSTLTAAMADPNNLIEMPKEAPDSGGFDKEIEKFIEDEDSAMLNKFRSKYYKAVLPTMLSQLEAFGAFE